MLQHPPFVSVLLAVLVCGVLTGCSDAYLYTLR